MTKWSRWSIDHFTLVISVPKKTRISVIIIRLIWRHINQAQCGISNSSNKNYKNYFFLDIGKHLNPKLFWRRLFLMNWIEQLESLCWFNKFEKLPTFGVIKKLSEAGHCEEIGSLPPSKLAPNICAICRDTI